MRLFLLPFLAAVPMPAWAATFSVNTSTSDAGDLVCDAICDSSAAAGLQCTLRAAIDEANCQAGNDTVLLPALPHTMTVAGAGEDVNATGDYDITCDTAGNAQDLLVTGPTAGLATVDAAGLDRVFDLHCAESLVILERMIIENGDVNGDGGGVNARVDTVLMLKTATVRDNHAEGNGGGVHLSDNVNADVFDSTIATNTAEGHGGGLFLNGDSVNVERSTLSENTAALTGGGLFVLGVTTMENSTISGNTSGGAGGGMLRFGGSTTLTNVTVADNAAGANGGGIHSGPNAAAVAIAVQRSIVDGNSAGGTGPDCEGMANIGFAGSLLSATSSCPGVNLGGNVANVSAMLNALANNGGPTETHTLQAGSPALDALAAGPAFDQRGVARPVGGAFDMGATEQ
jgi:hypothetical protein